MTTTQSVIGVSIVLGASLFINFVQLKMNARLNEKIGWFELHFEETPGLYRLTQLEKQVRRLNKRVVNLLESPKTYLRARRITSTLDLPADELTAELELFCMIEAEKDLATT